jgi:elongation factor P
MKSGNLNRADSRRYASKPLRNKPAVLVNGQTVIDPEYLENGEVVRVNTESGRYVARVKTP